MTEFLSGFGTALDPANLLYCLLGVILGNIVGVLPGIGAIAAISILLPVTFYLEPTTAVIMLAGVYYGAEYGGSIASILLNLPGTASNAITTLDGYPLAKRGEAGTALLTAQVSSFCGGTLGILAMVLLSPLIVKFSLSFGPVEYFATLLLGAGRGVCSGWWVCSQRNCDGMCRDASGNDWSRPEQRRCQICHGFTEPIGRIVNRSGGHGSVRYSRGYCQPATC